MAVTSHRNHSKHKQNIQQRMLVLQTFLQICNHFRLDTEIRVTNTLLHLRMSALLSSVECLLIGPASFLFFFHHCRNTRHTNLNYSAGCINSIGYFFTRKPRGSSFFWRRQDIPMLQIFF